MGYKESALNGVTWSTLLRFGSRGIAVLKTIILARIFSPSQFGVFAIVSIVLALFEVVTETGINVYIVQEKSHVKTFINEAWVISILRGLIIGLLIIVSAPFIGSFFNNSKSLGLLLLASLIPIARGFINPAEAIFQKELKFRNEFNFRLVIFFFESIATVLLALITRSISSLVLGLVASALFEVILSFIVFEFKPKFKFDKNIAADILHRGKWVTASNLFSYLATEVDSIGVGKILGSSTLGIYQMAYTIATLPITEVSDVVSKVTFPVFVKISGDKKRLAAAYFKSSALIGFISTCGALVLIFFPKEVIHLVLGDKWLMAATVLPILSVYSIIRSIFGYVPTLLLSVNKQKYVAILLFIRLVGLAVALVPLTLAYGLMGTGIAVLISAIVEVPFDIYFLIKEVR